MASSELTPDGIVVRAPCAYCDGRIVRYGGKDGVWFHEHDGCVTCCPLREARPRMGWGDDYDHRWFAGWDERDSWPGVKVEVELLPWHWRLRPRWYLDDTTWSWDVQWLFFKVQFFTNGGRKARW